jgi:excisionase family DNA binding protein
MSIKSSVSIVTDEVVIEPTMTDLPTKNLLRVSECAAYFGVHERTIRLWIEHGHLIAEKPVGTVFISRESIKNFRLMGRRVE